MTKITAQTVWTWPRPYLEQRFMRLYRARDTVIGIAFCSGAMFGAVAVVLAAWWLP